jgi:Family of unknown function (DUF5309)
MSAANLDVAKLAAALSGGLINEDVLQQVYNLDEGIPTPFTDMVGGGSFSNPYSEWTRNDLSAVDTANAVLDGADVSDNQAKIGTRVGNRRQISDKAIQVSDGAEDVSSVGGVGTMAYQTARRLMDLRRDVEAIALGIQASIADDGSVTAGKTGGFDAWMTSNTDNGAAGVNGGFNTGTKIVTAYTPGTKRALSFAKIVTQAINVYKKGGNPTVLMSVPDVIAGINNFLLTAAGAPYRATPNANVNGDSPIAQTAQGWFDTIVLPMGIRLKLVANRLQQTYGTTQASVLLVDPRNVAIANTGYVVNPMAKTGHAEKKLARVHWMVKVYREDAHASIRDIDPTLAVTA